MLLSAIFFLLASILSGSSVEELIKTKPFPCDLTLALIEQTDSSETALFEYVEEAIDVMNAEAIACICNEFTLEEHSLYQLFNDALKLYILEKKENNKIQRYQCITAFLDEVKLQPYLGHLETVCMLQEKAKIPRELVHDLLLTLLDHGAPITANFFCHLANEPVFLELYLERMPDACLNEQDDYSQTGLLYAGRMSDRKLACQLTEKLLDRGADPNIESVVLEGDRGTNPLVQALNLGRYDIVLLLLRHGAHIDEFVKINRTLKGLYFCRVVLPKIELLLAAKLFEAESAFNQLPHELVDEIVRLFMDNIEDEKMLKTLQRHPKHPHYG